MQEAHPSQNEGFYPAQLVQSRREVREYTKFVFSTLAKDM